MRGLFEKDLRMLFQNKKFLSTYFLVMLVTFMVNDASFLVFFCSFFGLMIASSSIGYDEYDNGYPFLFTLPITRKEYVREKYVLTFVLVLLFWGFGMLLSMIKMFIDPLTFSYQQLFVAGIYLAYAIFLMFLILPVYLKYGGEKGRIVIILVVLLCLCPAVVFLNFMPADEVNRVILWSQQLPVWISIIGLVMLWIVTGFFSYRISVRIMQHKQF